MRERAFSVVEAQSLIEQVCRRVEQDLLFRHREVAVRIYSGAIRLGATVPAANATVVRPVASTRPVESGEVALRLSALEDSLLSRMERSLLAIGATPPCPSTLRGYIGRISILFLGRLLWWYTRSVMAFGDAISKQFHDEVALMTAVARIQEEHQTEIAILREELRQLRGGAAGACDKERS
jgi:hypothetical protein